MEEMRALLRGTLGKSLAAMPALDRLAAAWLIACGRTMAERGTVVDYVDGIVRLEVCDRAWLEQMKGMRIHLQGELARIAGVKVTEIHFVVKR